MKMLPKILLAFLLLVSLSLVQGLISNYYLHVTATGIADASSHPVAQVDAARSAWNNFQQANQYLAEDLQMTEHGDPAKRASRFGGLIMLTDDQIRKYLDSHPSDEGKAMAEQARKDVFKWRIAATKLLGNGQAPSITSPHVLDAMEGQIGNSLDKLVTIAMASAAHSRAEMDTQVAQSNRLLLLMSAAIAITGCIIALLLAFRITRPLVQTERRIVTLMEGDLESDIPGTARKDEIGQIARAVSYFRERLKERHDAISHERKIVAESIGKGIEMLASRDLTYRLDKELPDAYRNLQDDFNKALDQLENVMAAVTGATGKITNGTREISSASNELSRRTEMQAASLEEATASISGLTAKVNDSASGAREARNFVVDTRKAADACSDEMTKATDAIGRISSTSQRMTQIINTIDEIAFQTNLLALNAGVEAARAGDSGRGFAVVASEVRSLAQRSAESAKEISQLIQTSLDETRQGVELVAATRMSLTSIIDRVNKLDDLMQELASTSVTQAEDLKSVSSAVGRIDSAVQQNATMVEETTASTRTLAGESLNLNNMIETFVVKARKLTGESHIEQDEEAFEQLEAV